MRDSQEGTIGGGTIFGGRVKRCYFIRIGLNKSVQFSLFRNILGFKMASKTTKLMRIRDHKMATQGKNRKNKVRRLGTTAPNLPLNMPNAQEKANLAAKAKKR